MIIVSFVIGSATADGAVPLTTTIATQEAASALKQDESHLNLKEN